MPFEARAGSAHSLARFRPPLLKHRALAALWHACQPVQTVFASWRWTKPSMNGADGKAGPRVPKPLESEPPRPRPAKAVAPEKRAPAAHVDFAGSDAALHKQLAALQAHMAELRTVRASVRGIATSDKHD